MEQSSVVFRSLCKRFGLAGVFAGMVVLACLGVTSCSEDDDPVHVHSYGEWESVKNPTCGENGLSQRKCNCGDIEEKSVPATGEHDYSLVVGHKDADCTEAGYDLKKCSVCGDEKKDNIVSAKGHDYGDWVVDKVADKDHIGKKHHVCNSCGNSESKDDASKFFSHDEYSSNQIIDNDGIARYDNNNNGIVDEDDVNDYSDLTIGDECLMNKKARDPNSKYYGKKHDHYISWDDNKKYVRWDMNNNGEFYNDEDENEGPFKFRTVSGVIKD